MSYISSMFGSNPIIQYLAAGDIAGLLIYLLSLLLAMCIAVSFHEWAHAFVAYKLGDPTAKNMGRMSLDPMRHMDWVGLLFFVFFRIGWAKPVIVNSRNLKHFRRDDILISMAGVVTNLLIAFIVFGVLFYLNIFVPDFNYYIWTALYMIFIYNISFAVFNILPIPPLDGFHVVTSLFIRKNYKVVQFLQKYGFIILIALLLTGILGRLLTLVVGALQSVFTAFYALFL